MVSNTVLAMFPHLTLIIAEIMAIQAGMTAVRYYFNVCSSPANQLELVMEGVQVKTTDCKPRAPHVKLILGVSE